MDIPERPGSSEGLEYDPEWLAILKATNTLQRTTPHPWNPPENNGLHERYTRIHIKVTRPVKAELSCCLHYFNNISLPELRLCKNISLNIESVSCSRGKVTLEDRICVGCYHHLCCLGEISNKNKLYGKNKLDICMFCLATCSPQINATFMIF